MKFDHNTGPVVVVLGVLVVGHYLWYKLQSVEELVPPQHRTEQRVIKAYQKRFNEIKDKMGFKSDSSNGQQ